MTSRHLDRWLTVAASAALTGAAVVLMLAPLALAASYSWIEHTTSQAGAQGVHGAWVARAGFLLFAIGVATVTARSRERWGQAGTVLHLGFAACMVAVATFSLRSWIPEASYDVLEDVLHSVAATVMGFVFAFGVVVVAIGRGGGSATRWVLDVVAIAASVLIPLGMSLAALHAGLLQRVMFGIALVWYAREATRPRANRDAPTSATSRGDRGRAPSS